MKNRTRTSKFLECIQKKENTHRYLAPNSCHSDRVNKNIPTTVVHRCRTNCSDKVKDDSLFKDSLVT